MKKLFIYSLVCLSLLSCEMFQDDDEQFTDAYKKILVAREIYQNDTAKGNAEVDKIYREFGFTKESFKERYYTLAKKNPERFQEALDSIRESTQRELTEYHIKLRKNRIPEE